MFAPYIYARERTTNRLPAISSRPARAKPRLKNRKKYDTKKWLSGVRL